MIDYILYRQCWIRFDEKVNVVWHDLHLLYGNSKFFRFLIQKLLKTGINSTAEDFSPVLRAPYQMI